MLSINVDGSVNGWCVSCRNREAIAKVLASEEVVVQPRDKAMDKAATEKMQLFARSIWEHAAYARNTPAQLYLERRGIGWLANSSALRFSASVSRPGTKERFPAMLAAVTDIRGELIAVHRTYITLDGVKAGGHEPAKASLGPIWGGMIRLVPYRADYPLVIGEGIETSASAGKLIDAPSWAAISAGNLEAGLKLPKEVARVIVAADPDAPGEAAATAAALRWQAEGREALITRPVGEGDFNDVLQDMKR
jgi:phage/plasmid primase-like uncharacterized protein